MGTPGRSRRTQTPQHRLPPLDAAGGRHGPRNSPSRKKVRHARTRFDGTAAVIDADLLRAKITEGIGRGKAYGCGLLTIAPARTPQ